MLTEIIATSGRSIIAFALAGFCVYATLSLSACGDTSEATSDTTGEASSNLIRSETSTDTVDENSEVQWPTYDTTPREEFNKMTQFFTGQTDDMTAYYAHNDDMSWGTIVVIDNSDGSVARYIGPITEPDEETGYVTISDMVDYYNMAFLDKDNGDGTHWLNLGNLGKYTVSPCEKSVVNDALMKSHPW